MFYLSQFSIPTFYDKMKRDIDFKQETSIEKDTLLDYTHKRKNHKQTKEYRDYQKVPLFLKLIAL